MGKLMFDTPHFELYANNGPLQIRVSIAMMVISVLGVALRFYAKRLVGQRFLWDDWMVLAAVPCSWGVSIAEILAVKHADLGRHIQLAIGDPSKIQYFFKALYVSQILYTVSIALSKFSITLFYRRIFQVERTNISLIALEGFLGLRFIASIIVVVCSCLPVYTFWTKEDQGSCVDSASYLLATAVTNIASDLVILVFPIPIIWNLQMFKAQKISILAFFLLGGFIVVVSVLRLVAIVQQRGDEDVTWAWIPFAVWTTIETNVAIFCACIPSMRPLLRLLQNKYHSDPTDQPSSKPSRGPVHKRWWSSLRTPTTRSENHANFEMLGEYLEFGNAKGPHTTITGGLSRSDGDRGDDSVMPKQGIQVEREITWA